MIAKHAGYGALVLMMSGSIARADMISTEGTRPWEICGLCHNLDGVSVMPKFPKLAGQRKAYIRKQFLDFHSGLRTNDAGQMEAITTEIDLDDLDAIAGYFSGLQAPSPVDGADVTEVSEGERIYLTGGGGQACADCHASGEVAGSDATAPWLQAQHRDYLVKQLSDFRTGARTNDPGQVMQRIAGALTESEIDALASYLASTRRPAGEE